MTWEILFQVGGQSCQKNNCRFELYIFHWLGSRPIADITPPELLAVLRKIENKGVIEVGASQQFEAAGMDRKHWSTASPIRTIFRNAFTSAGLPYYNPHSFRNTLVMFGEQVCKTPEQFKAWSQNLGHEKVLTTFLCYGEVVCQRQGEIIRNLANPQEAIDTSADGIAEALLKRLNNAGVSI